MDIGTFYYDDSENKKNGEFDVALKKKNGNEIYEAIYYIGKTKEKEILEEEKQINQIQCLNI